jgi:hypothetical protein
MPVEWIREPGEILWRAIAHGPPIVRMDIGISEAGNIARDCIHKALKIDTAMSPTISGEYRQNLAFKPSIAPTHISPLAVLAKMPADDSR